MPNASNPTGGNNYHICDPKLDQLFEDALKTVDPAGRKVVYDEIQQYMYDNVLMIPLYARANVYAYQDTLVFPPSSGYTGGGAGNWAAEYYDTTK